MSPLRYALSSIIALVGLSLAIPQSAEAQLFRRFHRQPAAQQSSQTAFQTCVDGQCIDGQCSDGQCSNGQCQLPAASLTPPVIAPPSQPQPSTASATTFTLSPDEANLINFVRSQTAHQSNGLQAAPKSMNWAQLLAIVMELIKLIQDSRAG